MRRKNQNSEFIKLCLADALLDLMNRKEYVKITVNEICERAGVGRSTFYRHFGSKAGKKDLIIYRLNWSYAKFCETTPYNGKNGDWNRRMIQFLDSEKNFLKQVVDNDLPFVFVEWLAGLVENLPTGNESEYADYVKYFVAFNYFGAVYPWIKEGFKRTPEEIQQIVMKILKEYLEDALAKY